MAGLGFIDAIAGAVNLHQEMRDLGFQMGLGAKGAKQLEDGIMNIGATTGFALGEVTDMVSTLTKMKVPLSNMNQLATDSLRFSKITEASQPQIAKMTGGLVTMGGLGAKSISNMMATIVGTQRAFGMTGEAVGVLADNITDTTMILRNMGKSSNEIEKFQKGTVKLAGAFASVGIEASTATELIDRMLDPGKLENNALLFAKMGISIEDAMSGNLDPGQLISGLQGIGSELKDMAGPQASALANALGIPLNQLRQMGNMDAAGIEKMAKEMGMIADGSKELAGAQDDQATAQKDMAQVFEKIKGTLGNIVIKLMPAFDIIAKLINQNMGKILGWVNGIVNAGFIEKFIGGLVKGISFVGGFIGKAIDGIGKLFSKLDPKVLLLGLVALIGGIIFFKKKFASVATDSAGEMKSSFKRASVEIGREISNGISSGLEMAAEKGSKVLKAKMAQTSKVTSDDLSTRIREGTQYAAIDAAAEYQKLLSGQNTFGWAKKMNKSTAEWLDKIKEGGKPISMLASYYKNTQAAIMEKIKMSGVDYNNESESIKNRLKGQVSYGDALKERQLQLEGMKVTEKLSLEQNWELEKIGEALLENSKEQKKSAIELKALEKKAADVKEAYVKKLAPDALKTYTDELNLKNESLLKDKQSLIERNNVIESEKTTLDLVNNALKLRKDEIELRLADKTASFEDMENLKKINLTLSENVDLTKQLKEEALKNEASIITTDEAINEMGKDLLVAKKAAERIAPGDSGQMFKSFGQNLKDSIDGAAGLFKSKITDLGKKIGDSIHGASKAVAERMNPKNWIAAVRTAGDGNLFKGASVILASGIKGAVKGIGGVIGGVSKVGSKIANSKGGKAIRKLVMKSEKGQEVMAKIQEKLAEVMAKVMPMIEGLLDSLMPIADQLIAFLMPLIDSFMPMIEGLMSSLMPMIQGLMSSLMPMIKTLVPTIMSLVKGLLPPLLDLFTSLLPIIMMLVKMLLPPILNVLSFLLNILGELITALGSMISALGMKEVGDSIKSVGKGMKDAATGMSRSANLMSGAISELTASMTKAEFAAANEAIRMENLNKNTKAMSETLKNSAIETSKMTVQDIDAKLKGTKASGDLMNQMVLNNKELAKQYTLLSAKELANTTAQAIKTAGETNIESSINAIVKKQIAENIQGVEGLGGRDDSLARALGDKLGKFTKEVQENGGITQDIMDRYAAAFKTAGYGDIKAQDISESSQKDWTKFADSIITRASRTSLGADQMAPVINAIKAQYATGSAERKAMEQMSATDMADIFARAKGDPEAIKSALTTLFAKQGGSLEQAGMLKVTTENIGYAVKELQASTLANKKGLIEGLNAIQTGSYATEQQRADALTVYLQKNSAAFAATIKGINAEALTGKVEEDKPVLTAPAPTDSGSKEPPKGSIETKMYPAMLSAISGVNGALGFIQTATATTVKGGMTAEEEAAMKQQTIIDLLQEIAHSGVLSAAAQQQIVTIAGEQQKIAVAAFNTEAIEGIQ